MTVTLAPGVMETTFKLLRKCGQGRDECVVYWTGPQGFLGAVDDVVQPRHRSSPEWYEIDPAWITEFFLGLRSSRRTARAQVHTHPGMASHSLTDDCYPLAPSPGFLSLVLPDFATGPVGLRSAYLVEMRPDGTWAEVAPRSAIKEGA